jgi:hypothetical protein
VELELVQVLALAPAQLTQVVAVLVQEPQVVEQGQVLELQDQVAVQVQVLVAVHRVQVVEVVQVANSEINYISNKKSGCFNRIFFVFNH